MHIRTYLATYIYVTVASPLLCMRACANYTSLDIIATHELHKLNLSRLCLHNL